MHDRERVLALYRELRSPAAVAAELGIPRESVRAIVRRAGAAVDRETYLAAVTKPREPTFWEWLTSREDAKSDREDAVPMRLDPSEIPTSETPAPGQPARNPFV